MSKKQEIHLAGSLLAMASASVLAAAIVVVAPEVGLVTLGAMIAAWAALGVVRLVILMGMVRQLMLRTAPVRVN